MPHLRVMGILNVTPDSFSDGGSYDTLEKAVEHARLMKEQGANIIDVGGYSTRPGHDFVSVEEELDRVIPVVRAIRDIGIDISVDTFRSEVAKAALENGATMINDQWRGTYDEKIFEVVKEHDASIILMHNNEHGKYQDVIGTVISELESSIHKARSYGISPDKIWIDPGIGFSKSREEELELMKRLDELVEMGYPVLLATSRKRMISALMNGESTPEERDEVTAVTSIYGIEKGVKGVRVHNVKMNRMMADAYMKLRGQI